MQFSIIYLAALVLPLQVLASYGVSCSSQMESTLRSSCASSYCSCSAAGQISCTYSACGAGTTYGCNCEPDSGVAAIPNKGKKGVVPGPVPVKKGGKPAPAQGKKPVAGKRQRRSAVREREVQGEHWY